MPGLFGRFGPRPGLDAADELASMERSLQPKAGERQLPYRAIHRRSTFAAVGLLHHGVLDDPAASREPVTAVVDGWLWPRTESPDSPETAAETCLRLYADYGPDFLDHVDGEFALALVDGGRQRAILANDRFGLRPLNVYRSSRSFYFAPEAKAIVACGAASAEVDLATLHRYLSFGRIFLDAGTFFRGIEILEPSTTLIFDARSDTFSVHRRSHSSYRPRTTSVEALADEVAEGLRRGVRRRLRPGLRYGMHLSGGLDSRLIAGVVSEELGEGGLLACTFGMEQSGEVALAEQIADRLSLECRSLTLEPGDFVDSAALGVWRTEGLDLLTQSYAFGAFPHFAPEVDVMTTGLALDLPLGGSFMAPDLLTPDVTPDAGLAHVSRKVRTMSPELLERLLGPSNRARQSEAELRDLWRHHIEDRDESVPDLVDGFMLRWRVWRVIIQRQSWLRYFYEDTTPSYDVAHFDLLLEIPASERLGHAFYQKILTRLTPHLMDVPYQRTLLPASAPVDLWPRAARLEAERERLYFETWRATDGEVYVPYRRYFSNYDEWLRLDPTWARFFDDLFAGPEILLRDVGFNAEVIRNLLDEHRAGAANHRQVLLQLATLETLLRQHFA
ncbi:MAG: asparagine synthase-related protein [Acidobacteriota bacterium]